MTETRPTTSITWAEGPSEYTTTDPAAKKVVGWDANEIPTAEHHNWMLRELAKWTRYSERNGSSSFHEAHEAIDDGYGYPETFRVVAPENTDDSQPRRRGAQAHAKAIGSTVQFTATDGRYLYVVAGDILSAYDPGDRLGAALWSNDYSGDGPATSLAVDGDNVLLGLLSDGNIYAVSADDGTGLVQFGGAQMGEGPLIIATDGRYVIARTASTQGSAHVYSRTAKAAWTFLYTITVDAPLAFDAWTAIDVQGGSMYAVHFNASAVEYEIRRYSLGAVSATNIYSVFVPWDATGTGPEAISVDGDAIYLASTRQEQVLAGGVFGTVWALSKVDGATVFWLHDFGPGVDASEVKHNSRYICAIAGSDGILRVMDRADGRLYDSESDSTTGEGSRLCMDEVSAHVRSSDDDEDVIRFWLGQAPIMMVADTRDPNKTNPHRVVAAG